MVPVMLPPPHARTLRGYHCKSEEALASANMGLALARQLQRYDYVLQTATACMAWPQLNPCGPSPLRTVSFGSACTTLRQQRCTRHDRHCTSLSIVLKYLCRVALRLVGLLLWLQRLSLHSIRRQPSTSAAHFACSPVR